MAVIEYRKVRCDECGKERSIKDRNEGWDLPAGWYTVEVARQATFGETIFRKEVCSRRCAVKLMQKIKRLPHIKSARL